MRADNVSCLRPTLDPFMLRLRLVEYPSCPLVTARPWYANIMDIYSPFRSTLLLMKQAHANTGASQLFDARKQGRVIRTVARPQQAFTCRCKTRGFEGCCSHSSQSLAKSDVRRSLSLQSWSKWVSSRLQATSTPAGPMAKASVVPDWYKGDFLSF